MSHPAYYNLIQFTPNLIREEACNIGVILCSEKLALFIWQITDDDTRARTFFPHVSAKTFTEAIYTCTQNLHYWQTLENAERFHLAKQQFPSPHIRLSPSRTTRLSQDPNIKLQTLFNSLVLSPKGEP